MLTQEEIEETNRKLLAGDNASLYYVGGSHDLHAAWGETSIIKVKTNAYAQDDDGSIRYRAITNVFGWVGSNELFYTREGATVHCIKLITDRLRSLAGADGSPVPEHVPTSDVFDAANALYSLTRASAGVYDREKQSHVFSKYEKDSTSDWSLIEAVVDALDKLVAYSEGERVEEILPLTQIFSNINWLACLLMDAMEGTLGKKSSKHDLTDDKPEDGVAEDACAGIAAGEEVSHLVPSGYSCYRPAVNIPKSGLLVKRINSLSVLPSRAYDGDAGLDLTITAIEEINESSVRVFFGIAVCIPEGYYGMLVPRSSIYKAGHTLSNSVGIIDSGYRGELCAIFYKEKCGTFNYNVGDRAAQLIIQPLVPIKIREVDELPPSERGTGGYGSSGT